MAITKEALKKMLAVDAFPRSSKYDPEWLMENEMGPNVLWLTEWLAQGMRLEPEMRVLDMGCGNALSSIFLARELGAIVWANDLWISPSDNWKRIREADLEGRVFPIRAEAHALPYAEGFFDAIFSVDSFHYYGTDDMYLKYFHRFVKPGGEIGIVVPGLVREFDEVPEHLSRPQSHGGSFWDPSECNSFKTAAWWERHWSRTDLVEIGSAMHREDGGKLWLQWEKARMAAGGGFTGNAFKTPQGIPNDIEALETDGGRFMTFIRMVARRKEESE